MPFLCRVSHLSCGFESHGAYFLRTFEQDVYGQQIPTPPVQNQLTLTLTLALTLNLVLRNLQEMFGKTVGKLPKLRSIWRSGWASNKDVGV